MKRIYFYIYKYRSIKNASIIQVSSYATDIKINEINDSQLQKAISA